MCEAFSGGFGAIFALGTFQSKPVFVERLAAGSVISEFGEAFFSAAFRAFACVCARVFVFFFFVFECGDWVGRRGRGRRGRFERKFGSFSSRCHGGYESDNTNLRNFAFQFFIKIEEKS